MVQKEWFILIVGSIIVFISFIWDYCKFIVQNYEKIGDNEQVISTKIYNLSFQYIPDRFPWLIFILGVIIIGAGIFLVNQRNKKSATS